MDVGNSWINKGQQDAEGVPPEPIDEEFDTSPVFGVGAGYTFESGLRVDGTLRRLSGYETRDRVTSIPGPEVVLDVEASSYTAHINGYWDFATSNKVMPFIGAGIGLARHTTSDQIFKSGGVVIGVIHGDTSTEFAYHVGGGVGIHLSRSLVLEAAYRYQELGDARNNGTATFFGADTTIDVIGFPMDAQEVTVGLRYTFQR
jgi:opacity protein-like surface antigen